MSVMPITSNTARIGPPAMMPVPAGAGDIITRAAPCWPNTLWWIEPFLSDTLVMLRRASSIAFCTAAGTSLDLPLPMPTRPSPSPTTVSAAKPRIRPPLTTLVTRLMLIIFSRRPSPRSSCCCCRCCILAMMVCPFRSSSELQAVFAGRLGERLDASVVAISRAVECHRLDAERLRAVGDPLADQRRCRLVAAVLHVLAHFRFERRRAGEHLVAGRRDQLRVDVEVGAADDKPRRALQGDAHPRLAGAADSSLLLVHRLPLLLVRSYFFFVSLITTRSS